MFSQRLVLRLAAMGIVSVFGWLMMWSFSPAADPRPALAQKLIDSGDIYQMTQSELNAKFGEPSGFKLHPGWDGEYELGNTGLTTDPWLLVNIEDQRVSKAQVVVH